MCDALMSPQFGSPLNNHGNKSVYEHELLKNPSTPLANSICEPDNGHSGKTESVNINYQEESERLKTFSNWKNNVVAPLALARAGFYFLNKNSDLVRCAFCNVEVCNWEANDDPIVEHVKWSPNCPYAKQQSQQRDSSLSQNLSAGHDVCGTGEVFPNSKPEDVTYQLLKSIIPSFEDLEKRLDTFDEWPKSLKQKPLKLAEAGFYYRGVGDQCVCFECGGGLKDWEDDDDPWEQHALWFPKCKFLITTKGETFVDEVRKKFKPEDVVTVPNSTSSVTKEEPAKNNSEQGASAAQEISLCKLCDDNEVEVVFIPCRHLLSCRNCSKQLNNICPVCRQRFDVAMRIYQS